MDIDTEKLMKSCIMEGIREGVKNKLTNGFPNPIDKVIHQSLEKHDADFRALLNDALASAMGDVEFREQIKQAVRHSLAKTLIARFGGELEKQVNVLKSDPTTRARITLAIEQIVKEKVS